MSLYHRASESLEHAPSKPVVVPGPTHARGSVWGEPSAQHRSAWPPEPLAPLQPHRDFQTPRFTIGGLMSPMVHSVIRTTSVHPGALCPLLRLPSCRAGRGVPEVWDLLGALLRACGSQQP